MRKPEMLAICTVLLILIAFPLSIFAYQHLELPSAKDDVRVIDLVARAPEAGGWSQEVITVDQGDTVRLRITSPDVVHGFAIGGLGIDVGQIVPGEVTVVEFVADQAGQFTYYCNVWCSPFHYRMRGTLEVIDPQAPDRLLTGGEASSTNWENLDIDAPHEAEHYPPTQPSAVRGERLAHEIELPDPGNLRQQSPSDVFATIRSESPATALTDEEIWDLVAYLWSKNTTPERLQTGEELYAKNCLGCHGETGRGDGPGSPFLEHETPDFTAAQTMAGGSSETYYAKTRRGGMGTGMPYFGTIFSEEETRSIIDYLWTFLFELGGNQ
jgi:cytochrome c oxidase subunit 2